MKPRVVRITLEIETDLSIKELKRREQWIHRGAELAGIVGMSRVYHVRQKVEIVILKSPEKGR